MEFDNIGTQAPQSRTAQLLGWVDGHAEGLQTLLPSPGDGLCMAQWKDQTIASYQPTDATTLACYV
jgi:hypothetical protein